MPTHQLLGAEVSLYTGKVRAYLRHKAIPFEEVPATREVYQQVIVPRTGVRFIPVLISDDDVAIQDSTAIIDFLEQRHPSPPIYPEGSLQRLVAVLLELYADEWLVIPAMHYRWNIDENRAFAIREFGKLSVPSATPEEQQRIGETLSTPFAGALPLLGVSEQTRAAIETSYEGFLREFEAHLGRHPFLLGSRPSIGDVAFNGPLYAHLYRDPASGRLMRERAPAVAHWVERMNAATPSVGAFLPNDELPATLEPLLSRMFREQGPVLSRTMEKLEAWSGDVTQPLPRTLGTHAFTLEGATGERRIYTFNLWRFQRAQDHYRALDERTRERADALLERVGGISLLRRTMARRLRRERNLLFVSDGR